MAENDPVHDVYSLDGPADAKALYRDWSASYDADCANNGYVGPKRCAEALAQADPERTGPVVDIGCGSGLSGIALRAEGFEVIDGYDFSEEMLRQAEDKGCYRTTVAVDFSESNAIPDKGYRHAVLVGVLGPGQGTNATIDLALSLLPAGGCLSLTLNDAALSDPGYIAHIDQLAAAGAIDIVFNKYGPNLENRGVGARVYVLRKQ